MKRRLKQLMQADPVFLCDIVAGLVFLLILSVLLYCYSHLDESLFWGFALSADLLLLSGLGLLMLKYQRRFGRWLFYLWSVAVITWHIHVYEKEEA